MQQQHAAATPRFPHLLHSGDYNPKQWLDAPEILEQDIALFRQANINCVSLGIFSWANLEPQKDHFTFTWLDHVIDRLYENGIVTVFSMPSGARPQWLAQEYPEVLHVNTDGTQNLFGARHNHCYTSPVYHERVQIIDTALAKRYANHPAVILWHISNEFGGECHCELCQQVFRDWLRKKYGTLDALNHAWWSHFWSHTYTDWSQVHSPSPLGETSIHGLVLDWRRFVTEQTIDFMQVEIDAVKSVCPDIPVTTNMMTHYTYELNYYHFREALDVISWDNYPEWHKPGSEIWAAESCSMTHDIMRSIQKKPFLMMECTPSATNWQPVSKLKKPGMHTLSVLNAIAHGANSGQYFQLRQSRGSCEKFHSAVISHTGTANTRTFREVAETGRILQALSDRVYDSVTPVQTAIIHDVKNKWALDQCKGPRNAGLDYFGALQNNYRYFWKNGVPVDLVDSTYAFEEYQLVIAPMLYLFRSGIQEKLRRFVENGGTLVTACFSGVVDETDLCFLGEDTPEKLSDVLGLWVEEIDSLYDGEANRMTWNGKSYALTELCELCHPTTCEVLVTYASDFYAGMPALTKNSYDKGTAYHLCASAESGFFLDFYVALTRTLGLKRAMETHVPDGVSLSLRESAHEKLVFVQNFTYTSQTITLDQPYRDALTDVAYTAAYTAAPLSCGILAVEKTADERRR